MPETAKPTKFTFKAGGKTYSLPLASEGRKHMTGRDLRDATLGGEIGQLGYLMRVLEASKPTPAALDALYDLPQSEMLDILAAWGDFGDGDGASLGE